MGWYPERMTIMMAKNIELGVIYLTQAAEEYELAAVLLARMYLHGDRVAQSMELFVHFMKLAAGDPHDDEHGDEDAKSMFENFAERLRIAVEPGSRLASVLSCAQGTTMGNMELGVAYLEQAAKDGDLTMVGDSPAVKVDGKVLELEPFESWNMANPFGDEVLTPAEDIRVSSFSDSWMRDDLDALRNALALPSPPRSFAADDHDTAPRERAMGDGCHSMAGLESAAIETAPLITANLESTAAADAVAPAPPLASSAPHEFAAVDDLDAGLRASLLEAEAEAAPANHAVAAHVQCSKPVDSPGTTWVHLLEFSRAPASLDNALLGDGNLVLQECKRQLQLHGFQQTGGDPRVLASRQRVKVFLRRASMRLCFAHWTASSTRTSASSTPS